MLELILAAIAGAAGMGAAVRWVKPVRDIVVRPQEGGPRPVTPP